MLYITARLNHSTPADTEPTALVTGVYESQAEAKAATASAGAVLPVTWSRSSRKPVVGETLATTKEASGLVAVVLPRS